MGSRDDRARIRRATDDDAIRLAEITVAGWWHAYRGIVADEWLAGIDLAALTEARRETIAAPHPALVLVAERDGVVIGYCAVGAHRDDPATAQLSKLYLDPAVIGHGIGGALHDAGLAHLAAAGFGEAMLWVFAENTAAITFYERRGWSVDGEPHHPSEWAAAGLRMRRVLDPVGGDSAS